MNQNKDLEFVSAAMDDDSLSEEALDKLLSDSDAQQKWYEYHLIRDYMQHAKSAVGKDIELTNERILLTQSATTESKQVFVARPVASTSNHAFRGFAVAASVLAVAVGVWQFWPQMNTESGANVVEQSAPAKPTQAEIVSVGGNAVAKNNAVANAEAQGAVVPNAAKAAQAAETVEKQTAVRVEKLPVGEGVASAAH
ncbi:MULTISPECIES: sigma-E factor negative regulatory protein [unclassified Neisseria]|uniref:sigma-E factor negative regulatory protein n=1 Tax=unclassified Neisseria TaxID=2623750 RepID=UPI0026661D42|nr:MULTISPECIES: sigma-E factor negative regulatory protein [unclassified Neisseria]MDO1510572.1 sigma-E factor negative regulatory protein [Neisseria sp. MVDL19-042950]MDO1516365.1 sigma-E factor negative regulatory protein [Neisseria sp. MVDL18-041461]MDO1564089.1 sigma-E factor negative regulatory protein [Neisseria sp. MVDL20-010259]